MSRCSRLPRTYDEFSKKWARFKIWLEGRGAEVRAPSNPYEIARFTTPDGVGVVYRNAANVISSWAGGADNAYIAFLDGLPWRAKAKTTRRGGKVKRQHQISALLERDGNECFYCGRLMAPKGEAADAGDEMSIEHLCPIAQGGPDTLSNMALAHGRCNREAGHLSVVEKVRLREACRATTPHPTRTERR